jgi:dipeptidyl aminopeptidase/acylaminoacyl peptidase
MINKIENLISIKSFSIITVSSFVWLLLCASFSLQAEKFTVDTLNSLNQLHDVQVSPQGDSLVYGVKKGTASSGDHLYLQNLNSNNKLDKRQQLTSHAEPESNVVFASSGRQLFFLSARSGSSQIWQLSLAGGEAKQLSFFPIDVNGFNALFYQCQ